MTVSSYIESLMDHFKTISKPAIAVHSSLRKCLPQKLKICHIPIGRGQPYWKITGSMDPSAEKKMESSNTCDGLIERDE
ncbi:hypothetical protein NPIL_451111 [Nephila pilipes]|uniref:Uncharacterized protein n=1 Tax=Nephila pilipes TaxID=299642 RepID=A0A8X6TG24_NEPPI|nr:hypothetical protein NPIL_451111 [Nephila pilipes]